MFCRGCCNCWAHAETMVLLDEPWSRFGEPSLPQWLICWIEHGLLFSLVFYLVWIERLSIFAFVEFFLKEKDVSRQNFYEWYLLSLKMSLILTTCINFISNFFGRFACINMAEDLVGKERVPPVGINSTKNRRDRLHIESFGNSNQEI